MSLSRPVFNLKAIEFGAFFAYFHLFRHLKVIKKKSKICQNIFDKLASPVWHGDLSKQQSLALERVQASVARRILKAPWTTPKNVLFEQLQWPSLSWRRSIATICLLHQLLQNLTDPLKDCLFPFSSTVSSYNFRKPRQLILPTTRTSRYLNSFFYHSALLWNSLPSSIQSITKPNHFRQALTSHCREQKYQPVSQLF